MIGTSRRTTRTRRPLPAMITGACACACVALLAVGIPAAAAAAPPTSAAASAAAFGDVSAVANRPTAALEIDPVRYRALTVDRDALAGVLADAPREHTAAARTAPLVISLPAPSGGFRRFAIQRSSVMAPALAAAHPEIATYSGTGIDDPGATVALDLTPLGLHASVRGPNGTWYVDPLYRASQSVYASYRGADLDVDPHGVPLDDDVSGFPAAREPSVATVPGGVVTLRTYRLALLSDPGYAAYFGTANVVAAKVTLISRVDQIYESDLAIHLTLVANTDALNLDTDAKMTGANGPCGSAACYTAAEASGCESDTLNRTRTVIGQLVGASNFDVGHIALAAGGGGLAGLGVVGGDRKAEGCTGVPTPVGDLYAVDYVAHELGHQFGGQHTFNGVDGACNGNISNAAVEPGSGVTIMAYAGICGTDNLQAHSDPYFSQRSIDEATNYVSAPPVSVDEVQTVSLRDFSGTDSFKLVYGANQSAAIVRGASFTAAGIEAAIEAIAGFPAGATVTVAKWDGSSGEPDDRGFSVTFGGTLAGVDALPLSLTALSGVTGFVGETARGGPSTNGGSATATSDHAPVVTAPPAATIPTRTPFSLTGSATDADGDPLTYLWEQNDVGTGTALFSNTKLSGPLFRVFGTTAVVTDAGSLLSPSPGENVAGSTPTRVFPDLAQVVAGATNAATGACPAAVGDPVPAATIDCYSEFLPTSDYADALHFRLTARDGHAGGGGVAHADTTLTLAKAAGPFRVTSQATATTVPASGPLTVTWSVAGTNVAPIATANVRITLSTDGGLTFPTVLAATTPNDGSEVVTLPAGTAAHARIKVEAIGDVFFDVSHGDLTIGPAGATTYLAAVTADAPRGYWRMGEPSGTTLTDSSGHANNGVYLNGVLLGQAGALAGDPNTAARFDGVNDMGRVNDAASLDVGPSLSVEGWVKRTATTASIELMNKGGNGLQLVLMGAASGNEVFLRKANVSTIARSATGIPADGRYHYVVATTTGATGGATIYVDGVASTVQVSPATQLADTASALTFGSSAANATNFDEFALYDQTLTAARIAAHFAAAGGA